MTPPLPTPRGGGFSGPGASSAMLCRMALLLVVLLQARCGDDEDPQRATADGGSVGDHDAQDAGSVLDSGVYAAVNSDVCSDDSLGSGRTPTPTGSGEFSFTTALEGCSLSAEEVAFCVGASPTVGIEVSAGTRIITGNGVPNHDTDLFPNRGNPNAIRAQNKSYSVTTSPSKNPIPTSLMETGVALNGIKFEPETAETFNSENVWRYAALTFAGRLADDQTSMPPSASLGFDCNFAHVQPNGEYHYHGSPTALLPEAPALNHVGWAADGFPILARYGYATPGDTASPVVELRGSYRIRSGARTALGNETVPGGNYDGTFEQDWAYEPTLGDLDECNGRDETITLNGETFAYAYYLTHTYPFQPRCVWGSADPSFRRRP